MFVSGIKPKKRLEEGFSNEDYEVSTDWGGYFVKINREHNEIFKGESASLKAIADTKTIRVPKVRAVGALPSLFAGSPGAYIILDHIYMRSLESSPKDQPKLGSLVAALHSAKVECGKFGFPVPTQVTKTILLPLFLYLLTDIVI